MLKKEDISSVLQSVRQKSPLVHNITNYVVMNTTANALLAMGASPVMAHATNEVEDMVAIASSLVINMGTLSDHWVEAMLLAGQKANQIGIPVVFDPVGVGATPYRTEVAQRILRMCKPTIIRGNASEIMALFASNSQTKGVDSTMASNEALDAAKALAQNLNCVVVISGATDYITNGEQVISIHNGHEIMEKVTGLGCTATALVGATAGVEKDALLAAASAMAIMGIVGDMAFEISNGPGSMQLNFIDKLYALGAVDIEQRLKMNDN